MISFSIAMSRTAIKRILPLITAGVLRLPSSLPLFVVYLTIIVGLSPSEISGILIFRAAGMMAGFIAWGRAIRRFGYTVAVIGPLVLLTGSGSLWFLFSVFDDKPFIIALFGVIAMLTAFAHAGLGLGIVTAVHNTAQDENAVVVLTLFDIVDMGLESMTAALVGIYIHATFIASGGESTNILFDPYMLFCLAGAVLAGVAAMMVKRILSHA